MEEYTAPQVALDQASSDVQLDVVWLVFFIPAWLAAVYYGSSWGWCQATCGWGRVAQCSSSWGSTKVVCRR